MRRRIGAVEVDGLEVLDLTDPKTQELLDIDEDELVGEDYERCQAIAEAARTAGFEGILAPSGALPGRRTLVVFANGMPKLRPGRSSIRRPPPRMLLLVSAIRFRREVPRAVIGQLRRLRRSDL